VGEVSGKQGKRGQNPVARAVAAVGGPTKAARVCGVSNSAIHKWINQGSITLLRHALALARASGVSIEEFVGEQEE
jgi:DNA-binding transcriptional regulator YdaS (Cro superfamily)